MADEKISAMTVATHADNADILPIVQAGANKQSTKTVFLTGGNGEDIFLRSNTANKSGLVSSSGSVVWDIDDKGLVQGLGCTEFKITFQASTMSLDGTVLLGWQFVIPLGGVFNVLGQGGGSPRLILSDGAGLVVDQCSVISIQYIAGNALDWAVLPPITDAIAIDRLAAATRALNGGVAIA